MGKSKVEYGARLIVDSSDNIYVTGVLQTMNLDLGITCWRNIRYIRKQREWTKTLGSTLTDFVWDITVDSKNNIYVTGLSENSFTQNINLQDNILLMKFNTDGIKLKRFTQSALHKVICLNNLNV